MSGNLKIWTIVFNPPLEKDALVRFYIMNGPTTKFRTKTIKKTIKSNNYYMRVAMKESRTNLNATVVFSSIFWVNSPPQ